MDMRLSKIFMLAVLFLLATSTVAVTTKWQQGKQDDVKMSETMKQLKNKRVLVLYFSRAGDNYIVGKVKKGNTAFIAEHISKITKADLFEITARKNYDVPYTQMLRVVREEWENEEFPEFTKSLDDISKYDVVFVGGPIWWGTFPRVMFSFFKKHDLDGKVIIPFTTNEGSGLGNAKVDLKRYYPHAAVLEGFSISGQEARKPESYQRVRDWLMNMSCDVSKNSESDVDGISGASILNNKMTAKGKDLEKQHTQIVDVLFPNGLHQKRELVVRGVVDMGLSVKWSATNLGAAFAWEAGNHYAWGENQPKESFMEDNYPYYHQVIGKDISKTWYDAARKELGGEWRMPTKDEWHELLFNTEHEWVTICGHQGYLFIAKNGATLFFPANGYIYDQAVGTPNEGYYWTSTYSNIDNAHVAYLPSNSWGISNYGRYIGIGIRAVK